jgi:hypothetical protein
VLYYQRNYTFGGDSNFSDLKILGNGRTNEMVDQEINNFDFVCPTEAKSHTVEKQRSSRVKQNRE